MRKVILVALLLTCAAVQAGRDGPKFLPDYTNLSCRGVVTGFDIDYNYSSNYLYLQRPDRAYGIKVFDAPYVYAGDLLQVNGFLWTDPYTGEQCLIAEQSQTLGSGYLPRPVYIPQKWLGGNSLGYNYGVSGGLGLNNIGLLARTSGNVTQETFWDTIGYETVIDDGSNLFTGIAGVTGVRFLDLYLASYWQEGDKISATGISIPWLNWDDGLVYSALLSLDDYDNIMPQRSSQKATLSVTITGGPSNGEGRLSSDSCSKKVEFDASGNASVDVRLNTGQHTISCKSYGYATELAAVDLASTGSSLNLSLQKIEERIVIKAPFNILPPDGQTQVEVIVILCDTEGYRSPNAEVMILSLDYGQIVSTEYIGDGETRVVVQASNQHEAGRLVASCGEQKAAYVLFYADLDDPVCWPADPNQFIGESVSGTIYFEVYCEDLSIYPASVENTMDELYGFTLYIDGEIWDDNIPQPAEGELSPMAKMPVQTRKLENDNHVARFKIEDDKGNAFWGPALNFVSNNMVYNLNTTWGTPGTTRVDALSGTGVNFSGNLKETSQVTVKVWEVDPTQAEEWIASKSLYQGTTDTLDVHWDGIMYPEMPLHAQPSVVYLSIEVGSAGTSAASVGPPDDSIGKWLGVKRIPHSAIQFLCAAGKPNLPDWHKKKEAIRNWPLFLFTPYRIARDKGLAAVMLPPEACTKSALLNILGNGNCRMFIFDGHGWTINTPQGEQTFFVVYNDEGVFPRRADITSAVINSLNLPSNQSLFVLLFACKQGDIGGDRVASVGAPQVPVNARNDMAEAFGMYRGSAHNSYLGFIGSTYGSPTWIDFFSSVNQPYGVFDLWMRSSGKVLSRVIGHYPPGSPEVLNQPGVPQKYHQILGELRNFGGPENQDYLWQTFTVF